jgi:hypothetical protein
VDVPRFDDRQLALPLGAAPRTAVVDPPAAPRRSRSKLLEEALISAIGAPIKLVLTDNKTSLLTQSVRDGVRTVRVHQMFLDADDEVRDALGEYAARGSKRAGRVVDAFIEAQDHLLGGADELPPDAHVGQFHDLLATYAVLNRRYFDDGIGAGLCWGQGGGFSGRSRTSITFGTYDYRAKRITVHPVLDQADVPDLVVARIVHHEMCHAAHPAEKTRGGRRVVHTKAFRRAEALFEGADEADAWLDENLDALLAFRPIGAKPTRRRRR